MRYGEDKRFTNLNIQIMEKKFRIVGITDGWIAKRDTQFNGKTEIIVAGNLTLKEAQRRLLSMFNGYYELNCSNWGMAVIARRYRAEGACKTRDDGTRSFIYDSRYFSIEEE